MRVCFSVRTYLGRGAGAHFFLVENLSLNGQMWETPTQMTRDHSPRPAAAVPSVSLAWGPRPVAGLLLPRGSVLGGGVGRTGHPAERESPLSAAPGRPASCPGRLASMASRLGSQ